VVTWRHQSFPNIGAPLQFATKSVSPIYNIYKLFNKLGLSEKKTTGEKVIILNQRGPDRRKWRRAPNSRVTPLDVVGSSLAQQSTGRFARENVSAGNALRAYDDALWLPRTRTSAIGRRVDLDAVYVDELARRCRGWIEGRWVEQRRCQRQTTAESTMIQATTKAGDRPFSSSGSSKSNGRLFRKLTQISTKTLYGQKLESMSYIIVADSTDLSAFKFPWWALKHARVFTVLRQSV